MNCPSCNNQNPAKSIFCNNCGEKLEQPGKTCPNEECKRSGLPSEALFCPDCGMSLDTTNYSENKVLFTSDENELIITSYSSYSSVNVSLVGDHLLAAEPIIPDKPIKKNQKEIDKILKEIQEWTLKYNDWQALSDWGKTKYAWDEYSWGLYWAHKLTERIGEIWESNPYYFGEYIKNVSIVLLFIPVMIITGIPGGLIMITSPINFFFFKNKIIDDRTSILRSVITYEREKLSELRKEN